MPGDHDKSAHLKALKCNTSKEETMLILYIVEQLNEMSTDSRKISNYFCLASI